MDLKNSPVFEELIQKLKDDLLVEQERLMKDQKALKQSLEEELNKTAEKQKTLDQLTAEQLALKTELVKKKEVLEKERMALESEISTWMALEKKLESTQTSDPVVLNVGGTKFYCAVETLRKIPDTYFAALVSGRWDLKKDQEGAIFIDQDPHIFRHVLTFLRLYGPGAQVLPWAFSLPLAENFLFRSQLKFFSLPLFAPICLTEDDWELIEEITHTYDHELVQSFSRSNPPDDLTHLLSQGNSLFLAGFQGGFYGAYRSTSLPTPRTVIACDKKTAVLSKLGGKFEVLANEQIYFDHQPRLLFQGLEICHKTWTMGNGIERDNWTPPAEGTPILNFEIWNLLDGS